MQRYLVLLLTFYCCNAFDFDKYESVISNLDDNLNKEVQNNFGTNCEKFPDVYYKETGKDGRICVINSQINSWKNTIRQNSFIVQIQATLPNGLNAIYTTLPDPNFNSKIIRNRPRIFFFVLNRNDLQWKPTAKKIIEDMNYWDYVQFITIDNSTIKSHTPFLVKASEENKPFILNQLSDISSKGKGDSLVELQEILEEAKKTHQRTVQNNPLYSSCTPFVILFTDVLINYYQLPNMFRIVSFSQEKIKNLLCQSGGFYVRDYDNFKEKFVSEGFFWSEVYNFEKRRIITLTNSLISMDLELSADTDETILYKQLVGREKCMGKLNDCETHLNKLSKTHGEKHMPWIVAISVIVSLLIVCIPYAFAFFCWKNIRHSDECNYHVGLFIGSGSWLLFFSILFISTFWGLFYDQWGLWERLETSEALFTQKDTGATGERRWVSWNFNIKLQYFAKEHILIQEAEIWVDCGADVDISPECDSWINYPNDFVNLPEVGEKRQIYYDRRNPQKVYFTKPGISQAKQSGIFITGIAYVIALFIVILFLSTFIEAVIDEKRKKRPVKNVVVVPKNSSIVGARSVEIWKEGEDNFYQIDINRKLCETEVLTRERLEETTGLIAIFPRSDTIYDWILSSEVHKLNNKNPVNRREFTNNEIKYFNLVNRNTYLQNDIA